MTISEAATRRRAGRFRATRRHHSQEAAEDYTELIYDLVEARGEARTGDIARHLGISHVTALRTLRRLKTLGFVTSEQHRPIELTAKGRRVAQFAKERHRLLVDFLVHIGVPPDVAEVDVEGAEHHISRTTLRHVARFLEQRR